MLVDRLEYLIDSKIVDKDKIMIKYKDYNLRYGVLLEILSKMSYSSKFDLSIETTHVYYKTENPLVSLIMFYYFTAKGKIYIMLPGDIENSSDLFLEDHIQLIEEYDEYIISLIDNCKSRSIENNRKEDIDIERTLSSDIKLDTLFLRAYSSGTSGMRKQVERTYRSWFEAFYIQNRIFNIGSETRAYIKGDISYTGNLNYALAVFYVGGTVSISSKRGIKDLVIYIESGEIDNAFLVPTVLGVLARYLSKQSVISSSGKNLSIITAGEKLQEYVYKGIKSKLNDIRIVEYYGASEVGHISYSIDDEILIGNGYVGKAFEGVDIKVMDEKIYTSSPYHAKDNKGYVCAGDYGSYENDQLYISGRGSNIISRSAKMINIEEIRSIVSNKLNCESYVYSYKDDKRGENYILILMTNLAKKIVESKIDLILERVSRPEQIIVTDQIITKKSGKIDYNYYYGQIKSNLTD